MHDAWVFPEFSAIITPRPRAAFTKDAENSVSTVPEVKQSATFPATEVSFGDIYRQLLQQVSGSKYIEWATQTSESFILTSNNFYGLDFKCRPSKRWDPK